MVRQMCRTRASVSRNSRPTRKEPGRTQKPRLRLAVSTYCPHASKYAGVSCSMSRSLKRFATTAPRLSQ
eukprot:9545629-Lingulodinium_polyedra.AAC.1